jgi:hypothetical protein
MNFYQVLWDNGHATDAFPGIFTSKRAARKFAVAWKREMVENDPDKKLARQEYSWEIQEASKKAITELARSWVAKGVVDMSKGQCVRHKSLKLLGARLTWARNRMTGWIVDVYQHENLLGSFTIESHEIA